MAIVISMGVMPVAVMMMVGRADGIGVGAAAGVVTGGDGDVGAAAGMLLEHAADAIKMMNG